MSVRALVLMCGLAVVAAGCQGSISDAPPFHINWNMDQQNRFDPQEPSSLFEDGRSSRPYVEGTVARGQLRADDHLYRGLDADGYVNALPAKDASGQALALDRALLKRGQERYGIYCVPCHDIAGTGQGVVIQRALEALKGTDKTLGINPPPSFHEDRLLRMDLGKIFWVITDGWGGMQSYASQIGLRDRWAVTAYVRALQVARQRGLDDVPAYEAGVQGWEIR